MTPSDKANREFWASRRAGQLKAAEKLSVPDFVTEANRQLGKHKALPNTRFVVVERRSAGSEVSWPSWEGPDAMRPIVQRIVQELTTKFRLPVPFQIDRC